MYVQPGKKKEPFRNMAPISLLNPALIRSEWSPFSANSQPAEEPKGLCAGLYVSTRMELSPWDFVQRMFLLESAWPIPQSHSSLTTAPRRPTFPINSIKTRSTNKMLSFVLVRMIPEYEVLEGPPEVFVEDVINDGVAARVEVGAPAEEGAEPRRIGHKGW